ncbi:RNA:NAD 2'-phosphotransferase [Salinarchaeum sp. Harcht-Bsk1]|uniref:RNA 2'-phosphotransferase n=1 Tax=Salinarchaeum sp. Harcht-Bsk1 TaxID=1333523 RepID=UPI0003422C2D|nr:RNA 2'-phosphotransferase [Salinarchaeum sp. Harcht-Bsk1]AGN00220.1 RNA:NAD 2'-phosphotransferase [Salinarchaeum sp. Harcht-Bsk1]
MPEVRRCSSHGFHEGDRCPVCGNVGEPVIDAERRRRLSKYLSGALRHFPDDAGIDLDERGWTARPGLVDAARRQYDWADDAAVAAVVATDPKGRFEVDDDRVRAAYGHSVPVELEPSDAPIPDVLYHGTAPDSVEAILSEGIRPMSRQLVHLSGSVAEAVEVGARHAADPEVLRVDAAGMVAKGHRITKRGNGVFTADRVPPEYVERRD